MDGYIHNSSHQNLLKVQKILDEIEVAEKKRLEIELESAYFDFENQLERRLWSSLKKLSQPKQKGE